MPEVLEHERQIRTEVEKRPGPRSGLITPIVGTMFPNFSMLFLSLLRRTGTGQQTRREPASCDNYDLKIAPLILDSFGGARFGRSGAAG
jgi:hypothetical protein